MLRRELGHAHGELHHLLHRRHVVRCVLVDVDENWDSLIGMSFLPHDASSYRQAPYEEISKAEYTQLYMCGEPINWSSYLHTRGVTPRRGLRLPPVLVTPVSCE